MPVEQFIPRELDGWLRAPAVRTYGRETIFDYIDGAGEVYRLYDFRTVSVFEFHKAGAEAVVVEVFDMGLAGDAYGIFTFYHEGKDVPIGKGGYLKPGLLCFWQGKYFVCLSTSPEGEATDQVLLALAEAVAERMPSEGAPPPWLRHFPATNRRPQSIRFFHNQPSLNYHYFLAEQNVLNLDNRTECALAWYRAGEGSLVQLWVRYPDSTAAQAARDSLVQQYPGRTGGEGIMRDRKNNWTMVTVRGRFLAAAFDVPSRQVADSIRQASRQNLREVEK